MILQAPWEVFVTSRPTFYRRSLLIFAALLAAAAPVVAAEQLSYRLACYPRFVRLARCR